MKRNLFFFFLSVAFIFTACQSTVDILPNEEKESTKQTQLTPQPINNVTLVLGGGGARGIAHVAAIEVLVESGIPIDHIVGCSSGSIVGALYSANQDIKTIKKLLLNTKRKKIVETSNIPGRFGFMKHTRLREFLYKNLKAKSFDQLNIPLTVVATDLITGELVSYDNGSLVPPIVASSSVPLLFEPIKYDNRILVDGGVVAAFLYKQQRKRIQR